ncbi:thrombospondin type 3 repeat-containing protein [Candidatus Parcubacteria bacterium]|nr:thrombospondin type 3 repeat-containing protein [Candidatus Parcubacteria bacterium]
MINKIKISLACLAVIASFSVYKLSLSLHSLALRDLRAAITTPLAPAENDFDHDGLNNAQEDYWNTDLNNPDTDNDGFKDGEEVASGHDPRIAGPDDVLDSDRHPNLTQRLGSLLLSGFSEGSLQSDNPKFEQSLNAITDDAVFKSMINSSIPIVEFEKVSNTTQNEEAYKLLMRTFLPGMADRNLKNITQFITLTSEIDFGHASENPKFNQFFQSEVNDLDNQVLQLSQMKVPTKWASAHQILIDSILSAKVNYSSFKKIESDPVQASVAFNNLIEVFAQKMPTAIAAFSSLLK